MKVRINESARHSDFWFAAMVGKVFEAHDDGGDYYMVANGGFEHKYILKIHANKIGTTDEQHDQITELQRENPRNMAHFIKQECNNIATILLDKNKAYGNSALEPMNIFSKASPIEQINTRIDDKLSRLKKGEEYAGDDTILDLIGYLILHRVISKHFGE